MMGPALIRRAADDDHMFGTFDRIVIAVWRLETRPGTVAALSRLIAERAALGNGQIGLLQLIEDTAVAPGAEARKALAQMHGTMAQKVRRSALVYARPGFAGAAVRAVMTGVALLNPPRFEHELFGTVEQGTLWLVHRSGEEGSWPSVAALRAAVSDLRGIPPSPPPPRKPAEPRRLAAKTL